MFLDYENFINGSTGYRQKYSTFKIISNYSQPYIGFVTKAIYDGEKRIGFETVNYAGDKSTLVHVDLKEGVPFGNNGKYHLNEEVINAAIFPELDKISSQTSNLIILDEIGRIEIFSKKFVEKIRKIFNYNIFLIGTIVFDPEEWSLEFKNHKDVILIEITLGNRNMLPEILSKVVEKKDLILSLDKDKYKKFRDKLKLLFENKNYQEIKEYLTSYNSSESLGAV